MGGLQAHTQGEVEGSGQGVSRPRPRGVQAQVGGVSQHALRQTTPQQMATAVDGMHPTGIHSCSVNMFGRTNPQLNLTETVIKIK